ncbi:MAG: peptide chain release factor N(5)-glutamine methyltransferase [Bacteroidota bacterium]
MAKLSEILPDSSKKLYQYVFNKLEIDEAEEERSAITYLILEKLFAIKKAEVIVDRSINLVVKRHRELLQFIERVNNNEPIQYILGEAEFYGRKFNVDLSVLIPRPETEELVYLIIKENKGKKIKFLDIGTGSGCIPITLSKELKETKAFAIDVDPRTIRTARQNANKFEVDIEFMLIDILSEHIPNGPYDVIVSNPPYIRESERQALKENVKEHEPSKALFVKDDDPLLFYRRIAELSKAVLKDTGRIYFEVHEDFGEDVKIMMEVLDFNEVQLLKDLNDKDRIVRASWSDDPFAKPNGL